MSENTAKTAIETYTGGYFQTNAYLLPTPGGGRLLIDAPEGSAAWLRRLNVGGKETGGPKLDALLLTHAHIDHIHDAAAIVRKHGCPLYYHADGIPLLEDPMAYRRFGLNIDFEAVTGGELIAESARSEFAGLVFEVLSVPGHCPGSLCFYDRPAGLLFAGDVLFAGSVGRTDLPGGDPDLLMQGIHEKLLVLDDTTVVLPGHGPATTIGDERRSNPYLRSREFWS
jgi:hydroxyacylglutathione hydrolase